MSLVSHWQVDATTVTDLWVRMTYLQFSRIIMAWFKLFHKLVHFSSPYCELIPFKVINTSKLVVWSLWNERNRRVHDKAALQPVALAPLILKEARRWARAGFLALSLLVVLGLGCNPRSFQDLSCCCCCFNFHLLVSNSTCYARLKKRQAN
jgi:hypothetical protein